jgi:alkanesulfonate monooxygenase SsuD/methylene tetrahydromethanopterin reductase-like flavin-dependent oxidoreductase (luciferase family)
MLFGLNIDPSVDARDAAFEIAMLADRTGIDLVGSQDHPYHRRHLDAWTLLTALAISTSRVRVVTNVANLPLRPPTIIAKSAASLAVLTGGRVILGLGAGAEWDAIEAYGGLRRSPGEAVDALVEAIAVIRQLNDPERDRADFDGEHYHLSGARPGPVPDAALPLWIGAYGPRMLALTGREADGWTPTNRFAPPSRIGAMQERVTRAAEEADRDPASIRRNYNVMGRIDPEAGEEGDKTVVGGVDHWVRTLLRYRTDLGFDAVTFWPLGEDPVEQSRLFAEEIAPQVRAELGEDRD